ncbi:MAG TPA: EAL domain-containing protein [Methylophilaceae bacterium]|nr:EAL domain-containing protein [Methylophilaceae bacterium]
MINPKVLLVNDHYASLIALEALLTQNEQECGYSVVTANSGEEALRHLLNEQFAVIILDVSMPGMDGFETAEIIHSHPRSSSTPIIFVTAHFADEMNRLKGYELGAVDYLITPIIPKILKSKVEVFVDLAKKNMELEAKTQELAELNKDLQVKQMRELKRTNKALEAEINVRRKAEERAHELAIKDPLTSLYNRRSLIERLEEAIAHAKRSKEQIALMFMDMDRFKSINDTLGHDVGDGLLQQLSTRISSAVRESDIVARLGGDEFVVLMQGMSSYTDAGKVARKIIEATTPSFAVGAHKIRTSVSIGISLFPQDGDNPQLLMRNADLAMYHAKQRRRGSIEFFHEDFNAPLQERLRLEQELQRALENNEFELYYQPKVEFATRRIIGVEALLRWHHPEVGIVSGEDFVHAACDNGLIVPIGEWVIEAACRQARHWMDTAGDTVVPIAVNIATPQLHGDLPETVQKYLQKYRIPPSCLQLEITESLLIRDLERTSAILQEISDSGISIAIDDFGTGYSSLSVLKALPIDILKIDQSFIRDLATNANDKAIVKAIIHMAHALSLRVIAEGVENDKQLFVLESLACDEYQGFLSGKPLSFDELSRQWAETAASETLTAINNS